MLEDLDATLEALMKREFSPDIPSASTEVHVSFETPFQGAIAGKPALNFFLYDVRENLVVSHTGFDSYFNAQRIV